MGSMMDERKGEGGEKNATDPHPILGREGHREEGPEVSWEMPRDLICQHGVGTSSWFHNLGHFPFSSFLRPYLFPSSLFPPFYLHLIFAVLYMV